MVKDLQDPGVTDALVRAHGIKGRYVVGAEEVLFPVSVVEDLQVSPFAANRRPCANRRASGAAGAGVFSLIGARPPRGLVLALRAIDIQNNTGEDAEYSIRFAQGPVAAITELSSLLFADLNARDARVAAGPGPPSVGSLGLSATAASGSPAGTRLISHHNVPAGGMLRVDFPGGFFLNGDAPAGPGTFWLTILTANATCSANLWAEEYFVRR